MDKQEDSTDHKYSEYFIKDRIISHKSNKFKRYKYAALGKALYSILPYAYRPENDTLEPILYLHRSNIIS